MTSALVGIAALRPTDAGIPTKGVGSFGFDRGGGHTHQGIDMQAERGAAVRAVASGVVTHASNSLAQGFSGYGRHVVIKHGDSGPWFLFAHLERASVRAGDEVAQGEQVGTVGDSCFKRGDPSKRCKGVHLHFEVSPTRYGTAAHPGQDSEAPRLDPVAWLTRQAHETPAPARRNPFRFVALESDGPDEGGWLYVVPFVLGGAFFLYLGARSL